MEGNSNQGCIYIILIILYVIFVLDLHPCGRDVKAHLNYEHRVFNSEEFLKTRSPSDQPFYKQVTGGEMNGP